VTFPAAAWLWGTASGSHDDNHTWKKFLPFWASELGAKNPSAKRGKPSSANVALSTPKI
jgi:hypothetical protein